MYLPIIPSIADERTREAYERAARHRDVRIAKARARRLADHASASKGTRPSPRIRLLALRATART